MPEANIVSDAHGIRADLVIVAITPLREALAADPGLAMPERAPGMVNVAAATLTDHRCASSTVRCSSSRAARRSSSVTNSSPARPFAFEYNCVRSIASSPGRVIVQLPTKIESNTMTGRAAARRWGTAE